MDQQTGLSGQTPPDVPKRRKAWMAGLLGVCLLAATALGAGYAMFDLFKSDKMVYLEAERKGWEQLSRSLAETYQTYRNEMEPYLEKPYRQQAEVSQIQLDAAPSDPYAEKILNLLKEAAIQIETVGDEPSRTTHTKVNLSVKGEGLIGFEAFADAEKLGFRVPEIYGKYAVVHWKDTDAIHDKYQIRLPKRLISRSEVFDAVEVSRDELGPVLREYAKLYASSITDGQVSINPDGVFPPSNKPSREITVTFSESQFKQLVKRLTERMAADEKLQEILYTRYQRVRALLADSGYDVTASGDLTQEEFARSFQEAVQQAAGKVEETPLPDGVRMVLYVDGRDRILGRTITLGPDNSGRQITVATSAWTAESGEENRQVAVTAKQGDEVLHELAFQYTGLKQGNTSKGSFELIGRDQSETPSTVRFAAEWDQAEEGKKTDGTYTFRLQLEENGAVEGLTLQLRGSTVAQGENHREGEYDVRLELNQPTHADAPQAIGFRLRLSEELGGDISIPQVASEEAIDLAAVDGQELMQAQADVQAGFQQFVQKRLELFREFGIVL